MEINYTMEEVVEFVNKQDGDFIINIRMGVNDDGKSD